MRDEGPPEDLGGRGPSSLPAAACAMAVGLAAVAAVVWPSEARALTSSPRELVLLALSVAAVASGAMAWSARRRARAERLATRALRRSQERFRLVFRNSRDAIFVTEPGGRILDANPACLELFGVDADALDRYRAEDFYADPADRGRFRAILMEDGGVTDHEVTLQDAAGRPFAALYSASVWRDTDGEVVGFHGTVRDISRRKAAETRLRESEERFRLTHDHAPIGIAVVGLGGSFQRVNAALCRIVGYQADELLGTTFQEITHPEDLGRDLASLDRLVAGEIDVYDMEKRYLHKDGSTVWVHLTVSLVRRDDRTPLHFVAHIHDVTERVHARRELQASERRFRSLIENGSELISLLDRDGITWYQSPAFRRTLGWPDGSLEGTDSFQLVHPEDRARVWDAFRALAARPGERARTEYRFRHADGRWRILETRAINLLEDPAVEGIVVNSRDVTERREAEAEVARSRTRLQAILDTLAEAVLLVGPRGEIEFANAAAETVVGLSPRELEGRRFDDPGFGIHAVDGGEIDPGDLPFARVTRTGAPVRDLRHAVERPDGTAILSVNAAPIHDRDGAAAGMVASIEDVTERTRAEEEIKRLNRELEERVRLRTAELSAANEELEAFAYSVSHDLRAPLRALDGFSQALMEDHGDRLDGQARDFLLRIQANSRRMARLIDDILELSRVSRKELSRSTVDLAELARETFDHLRDLEPDREVRLAAPPELPARGDPTLLAVVVENLVANAWKFTRPRPDAVVELGMDPDADGPVYWVRDNGVGFDMAYADKLFKAFHRLHRESEFEGTGIGLATVSRIVRRHGGTVEGVGGVDEGATFRFTLGEGDAGAEGPEATVAAAVSPD